MGGGGMMQQNMQQPGGMQGGHQLGNQSHLNKPNPYVQVNQNQGQEKGNDITYSYPKSKVFVGGLDFNLTSDELKDHF